MPSAHSLFRTRCAVLLHSFARLIAPADDVGMGRGSLGILHVLFASHPLFGLFVSLNPNPAISLGVDLAVGHSAAPPLGLSFPLSVLRLALNPLQLISDGARGLRNGQSYREELEHKRVGRVIENP